MFFDVLVFLNIYVSVSYTIGWNGWNSIFGKIIVIACWSVDLTEHSMTLSVSIVLHSIILYCCPLKLKMVKTSYPKPCKIGLRAYSFKK